MRYRDALHVDHRDLLVRRPAAGRAYAVCGAAGLVAAWACARMAEPGLVLTAFAALFVVWGCAWLQAVGRLWRLPLVLAQGYALLELSALRAGATP